MVTLDVRIELLEQVARVLCPISSKMLFLEEEVDAQICLIDYCRVLYGKVTNSRQDQVLERFQAYNAGSRVDEKNVRVLQCNLTTGPPETQLAIIPAYISSCLGHGKSFPSSRLAHFFSLAVGPCTGGGRSAIVVCMWMCVWMYGCVAL